MKKLLISSLACSMFVFAGCGGESSSSTYTGTKTLVTGNKYVCSSEVAFNSCVDDASCKAKCNLTYQAVKPVDETKAGTCKVVDNKVTVTSEGCTYSIPSFNSGALQTYKCIGNTVTNGSLTARVLKLNGVTFTCS